MPKGWSAAHLKDVVVRKRRDVDFSSDPMREYKVLTLSQTGLPRLREPGVGTNPPEWRGMYFADSSSTWYEARKGDIVYSGIDLWKGVVCYVTDEFDHALVTKEYPTLSVKDPDRVDPEFLAVLLRSKRFQKAFQAINTGHSNRRRTQEDDFGKVLVYLPPIEEQRDSEEAAGCPGGGGRGPRGGGRGGAGSGFDAPSRRPLGRVRRGR